MEFISEKKDYNVAEFYEQFSEALPKVVRVNQGYFGEIASDVFDKDQIIWLNAVSKQQRAVAKIQFPNHSMRLLSIPVTYEEKLCVVKHGIHGKLGKPKLLKSILEKGHFPVTVQFPKDHRVTVGSHSVSTNHIPKLELTETFDEMYFLGNYVTSGVMSDDVIDIPLYLSQLRFSLVTGIKDQTNEQWTAFVQNFVAQSSTIVYDHTFGNPDIAEYDPSAIHSCDAYSYLEPTIYSNIVSLVNKPHLTPTTSYQVIEKEHNSFAPINENTAEDMSVYDQIEVASGKSMTPDSSVTINGSNAQKQITIPENTQNTQINNKSSLLPEQHPVQTQSVPSTKAPMPTPEHHGPPPPLMPKPVLHKHGAQLPTVHSAKDIAKLSIDDVGEYLKKLKLDKHIDQFKECMIDGSLLLDVSKEMLIDEFGFKHSEVLRFMAFAQKGHIPS